MYLLRLLGEDKLVKSNALGLLMESVGYLSLRYRVVVSYAIENRYDDIETLILDWMKIEEILEEGNIV